MNQTAAIGHNNPPTEAEIAADKLRDEYELENEMAKSLATRELPERIDDEEAAGKMSDFIKAVVSHQSKLKEIHKREKEPFLRAGNVVDGWLRGHSDALDAIKRKALALTGDFLQRKEDAERKRLEELAEAERQKAAKFEAQAQAHTEAGIEDTAQDLHDAADQAMDKAEMLQIHAATAAPKQLAGARGTTGTVSRSLKWVGEIENIGAVDLIALRPYLSEKEIQRAIDAFVKAGGRDLNGVKIHQVAQAKFSSR